MLFPPHFGFERQQQFFIHIIWVTWTLLVFNFVRKKMFYVLIFQGQMYYSFHLSKPLNAFQKASVK